MAELLQQYAVSKNNKKIKLLTDINVCNWLYNNNKFLEEKISDKKTKAKLKIQEDKWGMSLLKKMNPKSKAKNQWSGYIGEQIVKELLILNEKVPFHPTKKKGLKPDWETKDMIYEVKTETYYTGGTAGEKILGTMFKYSDINNIFGKNIKIICLANSEKKMC